MNFKNDKHIFALFLEANFFCKNLTSLDNLILKNKELVVRITKVLRLSIGDELILFDNFLAYKFKILDFDKNKFVAIKMIEELICKKQKPIINLFVPVLKKPAFEEAIYLAAEAGVSSIIPVVFKKSDGGWLTDKEMIRLEKIIVSGREQGKGFNFIKLNEKTNFANIEFNNLRNPIFCDPDGESFIKIQEKFCETERREATIFIGPEAGFCKEELMIFENHSFLKLKLVDNILRAEHAVFLATGLLLNI